ncbi:MAG: TolC family protein [Clostridium sp.]|nr:TolC family protein [Clostridium sp.]
MKGFTMIMAALAIGGPCLAQDVNNTVRSIVANNPELQTQRTELRAERNEASDANALENPQIDFSRVWGTHGVGNKWDIGVSQSFDWPGLYHTRSHAADLAYRFGEMSLAASELDLAIKAKGLLLELVHARKCMKIDNTILGNISEMQMAADKAFEGGYITILDKRKLQIQRYTIEGEIADHLNRIAEIIAELQGMCPNQRLSLGDIDAYPIEPLLAEEEYMEQASSIDPMMQSATLEGEYEGIKAKEATQSRLPKFTVGLQHVNELGDNFNGFTLGMTLPFFQNRKARSTAIMRQEQAMANAHAQLTQRQDEITGKFKSMEAWRQRVDNYNKVFGDNAYLTLLKKALDGGEISIIEYLNETNYYHETTRTYLEAEYNYNASLAWLNRYSLLSQL